MHKIIKSNVELILMFFKLHLCKAADFDSQDCCKWEEINRNVVM